jgi:hypothetical protein
MGRAYSRAVRLTNRQLNRSTLARQALLRRERVSLEDAIRGAVALQAQDSASPYIALWNRIDDFDPVELDAAYRSREIVRATLMRITLHAVHRDDYAMLHGAMVRRLRDRVHDRRFTDSGLSLAELDALIPVVADRLSVPHTVPEIEAVLEEHLGASPHKGVWWAMKQFAPLHHAPSGAPWSFGPRNAFMAAGGAPQDPSDALKAFLRRYLEAFGPATRQDFGQFTLQTQAAIKPALESMEDSLEIHEGPDGEILYDVGGGLIPDEDTPVPPRLMAMWDSILLAYADRTRVIPEAYRKIMIRRNGDVLPTLLVDGYVAGVWRPIDGGIEATAFRQLSRENWDGLGREAHGLLAMLERDPKVYSRYQRWWESIDGIETRMLG